MTSSSIPKRGAVTFKGPGCVHRLAKLFQKQFKLTYAAALVRAREALGVTP